jgi:hypothetical protein
VPYYIIMLLEYMSEYGLKVAKKVAATEPKRAETTESGESKP